MFYEMRIYNSARGVSYEGETPMEAIAKFLRDPQENFKPGIHLIEVRGYIDLFEVAKERSTTCENGKMVTKEWATLLNKKHPRPTPKEAGAIVPIQAIRRYGNGKPAIGEVELELGARYFVGKRLVRFIRATPKGFNFLSEKTGCCLFPRQLQVKGFAGKSIPREQKKFVVCVGADIAIQEVTEINKE